MGDKIRTKLDRYVLNHWRIEAWRSFDEACNYYFSNDVFSYLGERDPKKRRVKPVDKHLLQLDFGGLEDSSDDSDYEVADYQDGAYCDRKSDFGADRNIPYIAQLLTDLYSNPRFGGH